jgi:hypothetical protein
MVVVGWRYNGRGRMGGRRSASIIRLLRGGVNASAAPTTVVASGADLFVGTSFFVGSKGGDVANVARPTAGANVTRVRWATDRRHGRTAVAARAAAVFHFRIVRWRSVHILTISATMLLLMMMMVLSSTAHDTATTVVGKWMVRIITARTGPAAVAAVGSEDLDGTTGIMMVVATTGLGMVRIRRQLGVTWIFG